MDLRALAESDLSFVIEEDGDTVTVTDPDGTSAELTASTADIGAVLDPETGTLVVGRQLEVSLRVSSLAAAGLGVPVGVAETTSKPWRITMDDVEGTTHELAVARAFHDRTSGLVTCMLEGYTPL